MGRREREIVCEKKKLISAVKPPYHERERKKNSINLQSTRNEFEKDCKLKTKTNYCKHSKRPNKKPLSNWLLKVSLLNKIYAKQPKIAKIYEQKDKSNTPKIIRLSAF